MSAGIFDRTPQTVEHIETAYRRISTQIPAPGTDDLLTILDANESRSMHGQMPMSGTGHMIFRSTTGLVIAG